MAQLTNTTPLAARLLLGRTSDPAVRRGCLVAKATFRFDARGLLPMDLMAPLPVLLDDRPLPPLGLLPRDDVIFCHRHLEVLLLGSASPGRAVRSMTVALQVGDWRRELRVSGDRVFLGEGEGAPVSPPEPFLRMPLTWERTAGGRAQVQIDAHSSVELCHPLNPAGRGHDPGPVAARLPEVLAVDEGYPRWDRRRLLPNVEDPGSAIQGWSDPLEPACWAPAPLASPMTAWRMARALYPGDGGAPGLPGSGPLSGVPHPEALHRAHPAWVLPIPTAPAPVRMWGLTPWGAASFFLPELRVLCDYRLGERRGQLELLPVRLVLLPDEARLALVFVHRFTLRMVPGQERAFRLRTGRGWYMGPLDRKGAHR